MSQKESRQVKFQMPWGVVAGKSWGKDSLRKKVLVTHGIFDNLGTFDRLIPLLPDDIHYVCIDLPGHGLSSHFPPGNAIHYLDYIFLIPKILDQLGWRDCIYMGHSLGAQLGTFASILFPQRIQKLILIDGALPFVVRNKDLVPFMRGIFESSIEEETPKLFTKDEMMYALRCKRQNALNTEAAEAMFPRAVTQVEGGLYKLNRDRRMKYLRPTLNLKQYIAMVQNFNKPTLVLLAKGGLERPIMRNIINTVENIVNNSTNNEFSHIKAVYINGNHDMHNNNPELVAPHIVEFLNTSTDSMKSKL